MMGKIDRKNVLVTGGAGFIGSNMAELLVSMDADVTVYDNLSTGKPHFIAKLESHRNFSFVNGDLLDGMALYKCMKLGNFDTVIHLAAVSDVAAGTKKTDLDLNQGTIATYNVLEAMRKCDVKDIIFSSSSVIYGIADVRPTPETYGPLRPISLYGASKLAAEGMITAFSHLFGMNYYIYRFANVVGRNTTHGVVLDFMKRLKENSKELTVYGDGNQKKSYIDVGDCVAAMLTIYEKSNAPENLYNLATKDQMQVSDIAKLVIERFAKGAVIKYTGGKQGWPGDVPDAFLDSSRMSGMGVKLKYNTSKEAVMNLIDLLEK